MSVSEIEKEIAGIKEDFSQISAAKTARSEPARRRTGSRPGIILAALVVIVIALLVLMFVLLF